MPIKFIEIGKIFKPHGLKGDVKVYPSSPDLSLFEEFPFAYLPPVGGERERLAIAKVKPCGKFAILHFKGVDSIEAAERLSGMELEVPEEQFPKLPEGEYYQFQLIGLEVATESGERLGTVRDIIETGSNDVYEVEGGKGGSFLLPAIKDVVRKVSLEEKKIIIRVMEGMLDGD